jgi:hypothetical protein
MRVIFRQLAHLFKPVGSNHLKNICVTHGNTFSS